MKDRYLFRGKKLGGGEWVEGHYVHEDNKHGICYDPHDGIKAVRWVETDPATLGQCTGLKDKNGRPVFEGDVVKFDRSQGAVIWGNENCFDKDVASHSDGWLIDWQGKDNNNRTDLGFWAYRGGIEIIGNVHDSPELLEAKAP